MNRTHRRHSAWRPWSQRDIRRLQRLDAQGLSFTQIGRHLSRTAHAVRLKLRKLGVPPRRKTHMSAPDVARLLGFADSKKVIIFIRRGWLRATRVERRGVSYWHITFHDVRTFLANPDYFYVWYPQDIPDLLLRGWATELRASGPKWLSTTEIAWRYHVGRRAASHWITTGLLPAERWNSNYFVHERDLEDFIPPVQRERPAWHLDMQSLSAAGAARMLGFTSGKTIVRWIKRGWLNGDMQLKGRPVWRTTLQHVQAFLANPDYFHTWKPHRITDSSLRDWALSLRADGTQERIL